MPKKKTWDYKVGDVYKEFTVIEFSKNKWGHAVLMLKCKCGCIVPRQPCQMKRLKGVGCNKCMERNLHPPKPTHGDSKTRLYAAWRSMNHRCYNQNNPHYSSYGGRGVSVSPKWRHSYETFRDWSVSNGYAKGLSIDRINNNGNYEPSNCRWVTMKVQCNNRRSSVFVEAFGMTKTVSEWGEIYSIGGYAIARRIRAGYHPEFAISAPISRSCVELKANYVDFLNKMAMIIP